MKMTLLIVAAIVLLAGSTLAMMNSACTGVMMLVGAFASRHSGSGRGCRGNMRKRIRQCGSRCMHASHPLRRAQRASNMSAIATPNSPGGPARAAFPQNGPSQGFAKGHSVSGGPRTRLVAPDRNSRLWRPSQSVAILENNPIQSSFGCFRCGRTRRNCQLPIVGSIRGPKPYGRPKATAISARFI
jgi:hypothetical protein